MDCEKIHMHLLNEENQVQCPFCDEQLVEIESIELQCFGRPNITLDGFKIVCTNCCSVHGYKSANEFVDFRENMYGIRKRSVYHKKYHILNVINDIAQKNRMQIGYYNREKILRIFKLIDQVAPDFNTDRKRMASIKFILKQLFDILGVIYKFILLTKSKKTLKYYVDWWAQIYELIKDDIN